MNSYLALLWNRGSEMVYCILVFVYCNAFTQFVPSSLFSASYFPTFSLNISLKIWPTSESVRFFKGLFTGRWGTPTYHVNVMKLKWEIICTGGLPHLSGLLHDWKETRRVKSTEANCVFRVFFAFHLFVFLLLLFTCLFYFLIYVVSLFTLDLFSQSCAYGACRSPP